MNFLPVPGMGTARCGTNPKQSRLGEKSELRDPAVDRGRRSSRPGERSVLYAG